MLIGKIFYFQGIRFHAYSLRVVYESAQLCTTIDPLTAEHIELITSIGDQKSKFSLFGCLNKCTTRGKTCNFVSTYLLNFCTSIISNP